MRGLHTIRHSYIDPLEKKPVARGRRVITPEQAAADTAFWREHREKAHAETARIEAEWDAQHGVTRTKGRKP